MICLRALRLIERKHFSVFKISSARCVSNHPIRFMETESMWQEKDGVSKRWQLIYKAPMNTALKYTSSYLTLTTGIISASTLYYAAFVFNTADLRKPVVIGDDVVIANSPIECFTYFGAFIALHVAVQVLMSIYVIRLYKDGDEYLAIYRGHWYNKIKIHKFHLNDFKKLNPIMIIPWSDSRYSLGSKKGILLENNFKTPKHFNYLVTKQKIENDQDDD